MVTRYDVVKLMNEQWPLLSWKGDEHAEGIYFNEEYGYLIERTYAVRVRHSEPAPSVFYVPKGDKEDEVVTDFPYRNLTKVTKNYNLLFHTESLDECMLEQLFNVDFYDEVTLPVAPLINLLRRVANKRQRDRCLLELKRTNEEIQASVVERAKATILFSETFKSGTEIGCHEGTGVLYTYLNANTVLHALNLFNLSGNVFFSISHDKIKLSSCMSKPKVEAFISVPKHMLDKIKVN
ncbi:hypothetical protein [Priestia megaterium]|uniref:hypothetical protein n=1 Tax=Priestia megaterium TaxID=1404 RepID=UPI000BFC8FEE|nr:hypothetical protein [Priestia megaterium]PGQ88239.1 hypothetical protein COA18_04750 [Priestia megaterium]